MTSAAEIPFVLGTAGHIDHGKTTLVKALTGVDCDRLKEEKRRGITIDLGFAPLVLPSGRVVSLVDVPGHERFIRQMVAGASGIDAVLFVVAADEGVMPQTREHLDILSLLRVQDGVVVLTKADLVDPDFLELAQEDVRHAVRGTFLEHSPMFAVSALRGDSLKELRLALEDLVERVPLRDRSGGFFQPIDRAFPISGFGTVVTGTAYRGILRLGDEVDLLPSGKRAKIRGLQVHGQAVEEAWAGQRVAVNLSGVGVEELQRGDVVCAAGLFRATRCLDVVLRVLPSAREPLRHWQRVRLHVGTSDLLGRVSLLRSRELAPGEEDLAQLVLEEPVVATMEERFVLRFYSPLVTIAGGKVLSPYGTKPRGREARKAKLRTLEALRTSTGDGDAVLLALVEESGVLPLDEAALALQEKRESLSARISRGQNRGLILGLRGAEGEVLVTPGSLKRFGEEMEHYLSTFHTAHPALPGAPTDQTLAKVFPRMDSRLARSVAAAWADRGIMVSEEGRLRLREFVPQDLEKLDRWLEELECKSLDRGMQFFSVGEARQYLGISEKEMDLVLQRGKEQHRLSLMGEQMLLFKEVERRVIALLEGLEGDLTLAAVRDASGSTRKYILPLLEHLDARGITRRVGDKRILRKRPPENT